jgi:uncharacterized protein YndB with AHSA1/START domain
LTDADISGSYWGHRNVSDWQVGSRWEHQRTDGSVIADVVGEVVESSPPHRLVTTWAPPAGGEASQVIFEIEQYEQIVRLRVTHENLADEQERTDAASGWSAVLSNLKTLLETGHPLPVAPWGMDDPARR